MFSRSMRVNLAVISFLLSVPAFAMPEKDTGNLGEIRQSVLSPENFQKIYGEGWILMDGRDVQMTDLFREKLWAGTHIPDARGVYLRSKNHDRDKATGDPNGDRDVGVFIADQILSHNHKDAGHSHGFNLECHTTYGGGGAHAPCQGSGRDVKSNGVQGSIHNGKADIQNTGGSETRPRSIVVNTYIKVNRTPESQALHQIFVAIEKIPEKVFENEAFTQFLRRVVPGYEAAGSGLSAVRDARGAGSAEAAESSTEE